MCTCCIQILYEREIRDKDLISRLTGLTVCDSDSISNPLPLKKKVEDEDEEVQEERLLS